MERKGTNRARLVSLRSIGGSQDNQSTSEGSLREIVGVGLGYRMVFAEQAEVWTVRGYLRDGSVTKEDVGELSFVLIPGTSEPATAITGFVAAAAPYTLNLTEDALWKQLRGMLMQLGYDQEGFYASIGFGGRHCYYEECESH